MGTPQRPHPGHPGNHTVGSPRLSDDYELVKAGLIYAGRPDTTLSDDGYRLALDALARIYHTANGGQ